MRYAEHPPFAGFIECTIAANTMRLIGTRWAAGVLVFVATGFCVHVLDLPLPELALNLVGCAILAYNALLTLQMRHVTEQRVRWLVMAQVFLDWLAMSIFVHLTGGITSPAIPLFLVHMLMVAILLPDQSPYPYVGLATGALMLIASFEVFGVLPHHHIIPALPPTLYLDTVYIGAQITFFAVVGGGMVYLTSQIMRRLHEREYQVITLLETAQTVSSSLELQVVMERLAFSAAHAIGAPGAAIRLLDESGDHLTMAASYGLSQSYLDKGSVKLSRSRLDQLAMAGQTVTINDVANDDRLQYPQQALAEGIRSIVIVPVVGPRRRLGVLRVYGRQPNAFSEADAAFVMAIGQQGGAALENALTFNALQNTERKRTEFVRTVTHELRAPVVTAQSLLRTLMRGMAGSLTATQTDIVERIERRITALGDLISDLLALAASKTIQTDTPIQPIAIQPILTRVVDQWMAQAAEKAITVTCDLPDAPLIVDGSEDDLARIFDNLIGNAVKYTPQTGTVTIQAAGSASGVGISIRDTGIGIPADDIPKLWNEFFRAQNARHSGITGTGLGLSIVKLLVEKHHAMISVQSIEGTGTTFTVRFPLPSRNAIAVAPLYEQRPD